MKLTYLTKAIDILYKKYSKTYLNTSILVTQLLTEIKYDIYNNKIIKVECFLFHYIAHTTQRFKYL